MAIETLLFSKIIPLAFAVIGFGALILIHELGHFFFCKLFGIHTPTFSIGFGPELLRKKIGDTNFRLALIPLGGYVEIAGQAEVGQGEQEFANLRGEHSFEDKPFWQKLLVMSGGIIFNFIFAYLVFCLLFMVGTSQKPAVFISGMLKSSAAEKAGLKAGDAIIGINNISLITQDGKELIDNAQLILLENIRKNPLGTVNLTIERDHISQQLPVTLNQVMEDGQAVGKLGAGLQSTISITSRPFFQAIVEGVRMTNSWIFNIVTSIKQLFKQKSLEGAGGPVMIMSMSFSAAQHSLLQLLIFLALISLNLALMNLLPIGALDGGQILFFIIEAVTRRKIPLVVRNGINVLSWLFFIGLAVFLTYKDIATLFGESIGKGLKKLAALFSR